MNSFFSKGLAFFLDDLWATFSRLLKIFVYPENLYCACCKDSIEAKTRIHGICDKCAEKINWISDNPFLSSMELFSFDELISCCIYGYYPRQIILRLKLKGERHLAKPLGRLMTDRLLANGWDPSDFDYICFVPSSAEKLKKRGFNQTRLLADEISKNLKTVSTDLLTKPKETKSMRLSSGSERKALSKNMFEINKKSPPLSGKKILLIDDVLTTGSTADEAARALKTAGAEYVCVLVFACSAGGGF